MYYPLNLNDLTIYPLFGNFLKGKPYIFDFSSNNPKTLAYDLSDFEQFDAMIFEELEQSAHQWGIGRYLEERKTILRGSPNIIREGWYYHLGLNIIVPFDTPMIPAPS